MRLTKPLSSKRKRNWTTITKPAKDTNPYTSRLSNVKFLTTFEADLVCPPLDRKYAAHLTVTAPKGQSQDPK